MKRFTAILLIGAMVLAFATLAIAGLPASGGVKFAAGAKVDVPATVRVTGQLTITGDPSDRPTLFNPAKTKSQPMLDVDGGALTLRDMNLGGTSWETLVKGKPTFIANRGIDVENGGTLTLLNVGARDGDSVLVRDGYVFARKVETLDSTFGYTFFLGDITKGQIARGVVEDSIFRFGRKEGGTRLFPFDGVFRRCRWLVDGKSFWPGGKPRHDKEIFQGRHGRFRVEDSYFGANTVIGSNEWEKDIAYAEKRPTAAHLTRCSQVGYLGVEGRAVVAMENYAFTGPDPRGVGPSRDITLKSYTLPNGVKQTPVVLCRNTKFRQPVDGGVLIGPGCTVNGKPLPVSPKYTQAEFDRIVGVVTSAQTLTPEVVAPAPATPAEPQPATRPTTAPAEPFADPAAGVRVSDGVMTITMPPDVTKIVIEARD